MSHDAISVTYLARKQAIDLARNGKNKWKLLEQEKQRRREKEEVAEKDRNVEARVEVVAKGDGKIVGGRTVDNKRRRRLRLEDKRQKRGTGDTGLEV